MYDALYTEQGSIGVQPWAWFAAKAQVPDSLAFDGCVRATGRLAALEADTTAAVRLGVEGTPVILVNGIRLDGIVPLDSLEAYVVRASKAALAAR